MPWGKTLWALQILLRLKVAFMVVLSRGRKLAGRMPAVPVVRLFLPKLWRSEGEQSEGGFQSGFEIPIESELRLVLSDSTSCPPMREEGPWFLAFRVGI